jgi:hypothetical protein
MAARRVAEGRDVSDRYERVPPPKMAVAYRNEVAAQVSERLLCCFDQQLILCRPPPLPPPSMPPLPLPRRHSLALATLCLDPLRYFPLPV